MRLPKNRKIRGYVYTAEHERLHLLPIMRIIHVFFFRHEVVRPVSVCAVIHLQVLQNRVLLRKRMQEEAVI